MAADSDRGRVAQCDSYAYGHGEHRDCTVPGHASALSPGPTESQVRCGPVSRTRRHRDGHGTRVALSVP
eukprot:1120496-Rhodomonas_salina.3